MDQLNELTDNIETTADKLEEIASPTFWSRFDFEAFAMTVIKTAIILIVGYLIIRYILKLVRHMLQKNEALKSGAHYIEAAIKLIAYFVLITIAANSLGIDTGSLIALVASLGLALGLALKDSLTNLASGIMIVLNKPLQTGDKVYIEGIDDLLEVVDIRLFNTFFTTWRNVVISLPNDKIIQSKIVNLSKKEFIFTDIKIVLEFKTDLSKAKEIIRDCLYSNEKVLKNPEPVIGVINYNDNGIELLVSFPAFLNDSFSARRELMETIFNALSENGIYIPFTQREIRILKDE